MTMYVSNPRAARDRSLFAAFEPAWAMLLGAGRALLRRPESDFDRLDDHLLRDIGLTPGDVDKLRRTSHSTNLEKRRVKL